MKIKQIIFCTLRDNRGQREEVYPDLCPIAAASTDDHWKTDGNTPANRYL